MTSYEQYEEVANYVLSSLVGTKVFMEGEPIDVKAPYVIFRSYGVANEYCVKTRTDIRGYTLLCYAPNRGRVEKLISDVMDKFCMVGTSSNLRIDDAQWAGFINKLEDDLYEASIMFTVESRFMKPIFIQPHVTFTVDTTTVSADSTAFTADATIR